MKNRIALVALILFACITIFLGEWIVRIDYLALRQDGFWAAGIGIFLDERSLPCHSYAVIVGMANWEPKLVLIRYQCDLECVEAWGPDIGCGRMDMLCRFGPGEMNQCESWNDWIEII